MLRVVQYGLSANRGGIETYILNLAKAVDRAKFDLHFVVNDHTNPAFFAELGAESDHFHEVRSRRRSPVGHSRDLSRIYRELRADVVHCHMNTLSDISPVREAVRLGSPVIVHSHSSGQSSSFATLHLHRVNSWRLPERNTSKIAVSQSAGDWLFGVGGDFTVHPNGIDISRYSFDERKRLEIRRELHLGSGLVVGCVGSFVPAKNHEFSLEVFDHLRRLDPNARLVIVGGGEGETSIRSLVHSRGLEAR